MKMTRIYESSMMKKVIKYTLIFWAFGWGSFEVIFGLNLRICDFEKSIQNQNIEQGFHFWLILSFCELLLRLLLVSAGFWASFGRFWKVIFLCLYWRLLFVFVFLNKSKSLWLKTCQNLCWGNANKGKRTSENPFNDKSSEIHISAKFSHDSDFSYSLCI